LESIIDSMAEVLFVTSPDGSIRMANRSALAVFEFSREELVGTNIQELFAEEEVVLPDGGKLALREQVRALNREMLCTTKHNTTLPMAFSVTLLAYNELEPGSLVWLGRDLREITQAKEEIHTLQKENAYLLEEIKEEHNFEEIVGTSTAIRKVFRQIDKVASTDATVLLTGETGTGKELIARAIHNRSARSNHVMVKVNCAALPAGLVESELFGHEKGAFTGATAKKIGKFEMANRGTIFLDEVGELPLETQAKLLRILQEREFERVGGTQTLTVDVRVIAATNKNLDDFVHVGGFREDLFYRLHVFPIVVPALRNRSGDVPLLAQYFFGKFAATMSKRINGIAPETMEKLSHYHWPGNVRELANVIERAVILCEGSVLKGVEVGATRRRSKPGSSLSDVEREHILTVLNDSDGVIEGSHGAARKLGLNPATLRSRMKKLGIKRSGGTFR
ncbi:MAG: sigma 54-interacting transcriptional regulator, partial [Ignavibacteria bacterium]|nr:sigma 54-interacting transcriptional regulator [Ignavibacteria bacterium]